MEAPLKIYTDGGCSGNPGPGGWAYVMVMETFQGSKILAEQWGSERSTTNNRMELTAVIESLRALKALGGDPQNAVPRQAAIFTDSQYVQKGITEWINKWKRNAWRTSDKKPVKNQDLWVELDLLAGEFPLKWEWVRGHSGVEYNERCDRMTQEAILSINREQ
ncbi:MAG: ribonuclease HI [Treponema sp.]|jgi:ribonuclease HI|nr:ribonuclease HI [Treponema sp.]